MPVNAENSEPLTPRREIYGAVGGCYGVGYAMAAHARGTPRRALRLPLNAVASALLRAPYAERHGVSEERPRPRNIVIRTSR